ncbi:MAG: thiol:disulfide interchange protein, partial [Gallionellaceae bacterium]|nr:thiol:disulfide interchange protein [Gallionellaceae bacterium]
MKKITQFFLLLTLCLSLTAQADGFFSKILGNGDQPKFLPPDQAFELTMDTQTDGRLLLASFRVTPDYYLYRDKIFFNVTDPDVKIAEITLPRGDIKNDPNFGQMEVFHQSFQGQIRLERGAAARDITVKATYQGCSEKGLCYEPIQKSYKISLPAMTAEALAAPVAAVPAQASGAAPENENSRIARLFKEGNSWLIISFFFGAGLLLAFTPCMFPMVPILSGIIVGRGHQITHLHGFLLSLAYVLGMAITYA